MNRRGFLTRSGLALGALIVGDEVLEAMERLTHRKVWALGGIPKPEVQAELWVRVDSRHEWVWHDRVPVVDTRAHFRRIPEGYTEAKWGVIVPALASSLIVNVYVELA